MASRRYIRGRAKCCLQGPPVCPVLAQTGFGPTFSLQLRVGSGTPRVLTLSIAGNNPLQLLVLWIRIRNGTALF
jgi:hypothetical protein